MSKDLNYSQIKARLEEILSELQDSNIDIDEALKLHKEGTALVGQAEKYIANVSAKLEVVLKKK